MQRHEWLLALAAFLRMAGDVVEHIARLLP
jgi:hypothetical protein